MLHCVSNFCTSNLLHVFRKRYVWNNACVSFGPRQNLERVPWKRRHRAKSWSEKCKLVGFGHLLMKFSIASLIFGSIISFGAPDTCFMIHCHCQSQSQTRVSPCQSSQQLLPGDYMDSSRVSSPSNMTGNMNQSPDLKSGLAHESSSASTATPLLQTESPSSVRSPAVFQDLPQILKHPQGPQMNQQMNQQMQMNPACSWFPNTSAPITSSLMMNMRAHHQQPHQPMASVSSCFQSHPGFLQASSAAAANPWSLQQQMQTAPCFPSAAASAVLFSQQQQHHHHQHYLPLTLRPNVQMPEVTGSSSSLSVMAPPLWNNNNKPTADVLQDALDMASITSVNHNGTIEQDALSVQAVTADSFEEAKAQTPHHQDKPPVPLICVDTPKEESSKKRELSEEDEDSATRHPFEDVLEGNQGEEEEEEEPIPFHQDSSFHHTALHEDTTKLLLNSQIVEDDSLLSEEQDFYPITEGMIQPETYGSYDASFGDEDEDPLLLGNPTTASSSLESPHKKMKRTPIDLSSPSSSIVTPGGSTKNVRWLIMLEQLKEYKKSFGHTVVPRGYKANPKLASWVAEQRKQHKLFLDGKQTSINQGRINMLNQLDFTWNAQQAAWDAHFAELKQFKETYGHVHVPHQHPDYPKLSLWVKEQRRHYTLQKHGKHAHMTSARVQALNDIGFCWDTHEATWRERLKQLQDYKEEHGDCNVPLGWEPNPKLGTWVAYQRRQHKQWKQGTSSHMTKERAQLLDDMGFAWTTRDVEPSPGKTSS